MSLHDKIIEMRHTYIAHGVDNEFEEMQTRLYLTIDKNTNDVYAQLGHFGIKQFSTSTKDLGNIIKLVEIILTNVEKKINKLWQKVMDEVSSELIETWVERALKK